MNSVSNMQTTCGAARIASVFRGKKALIGRLVAGDPTLEDSLQLALSMLRQGADGLLVCLPFSDPVAEEEAQQRANVRALQAGATPQAVLELMARLRSEMGETPPLLLASYLNPVFHHGCEAFLARCAEVGVDGLLIHDLPLEERGELREAAQAAGVALPSCLAPAAPARQAAVAGAAQGLLLAAGVDAADTAGLAALAGAIQGQDAPPLLAALGDAAPEQAAQALRHADGLVVEVHQLESASIALRAL